jgi:asparagine synthetase B (glutamine-hydrolysing)
VKLKLQDLNIGIALWLAASGSGWVCEGNNNNNDEDLEPVKYKSKARIVLVGSGADEQCAGYGRHRTKYRQERYALIWNKLDDLVTYFFSMSEINLCVCAHI